MHIGEDGTEQFTVTTRIDGKGIREQPVHDPFIRNTTVITLGRWDAFKAIFKKLTIKIGVSVDGSDGVVRAIMALDPEALHAETMEILEQRRISRENSGIVGYCATEQIT